MRLLLLILIYLMFLLSGSAALMYQVVWVRSLSLIFGGSHLAVTTVLSVFMAGLAIGGYAIGRLTDRVENQLRLYGWLEIGIALFAVFFSLLNKTYPDIYRFLAGGKDDAGLYLTFIRVLFSILALIAPTILMGGTLPVLTRFVCRQPGSLRTHLSFLYGVNTLGAVLGAFAAGFYILRYFSVTAALAAAIVLNASIGITSLLLTRKGRGLLSGTRGAVARDDPGSLLARPSLEEKDRVSLLSLRLVILGAGVSGFCALGYEVLWTRMLAVVSGATVYAFTTMLVAFLSGIALGSAAFGVLPGVFRFRERSLRRSVIGFGLVQIAIGALALAVTVLIRDLPQYTVRVHNLLGSLGRSPSEVRTQANFILAFAYMLPPAFFMGIAFPLAGRIHAAFREKIGKAVGEVLSFNTVGAILGAATSGFVLISLFGIERSLQMLVIVNIGFGLLVCLSTGKRKIWIRFAAAAIAGSLLFLSLDRDTGKFWDKKHFAVFRSNEMANFFSPELISLQSDFTDVIYYAEGLETVVSVTKTGEKRQSLVVNGKIVASTVPEDLQLQYSLGHLPMLLHPDPGKVLVVGLGTGMTLGAASVHPGVEELTLVEIEPKVVEAARTFGEYNHHVLDNPKLRVIYNDGRNFLYTTGKVFDVITADPIHPWSQGASYLYTEEYYRTALKHLAPDGIMCQWLPLYELSADDWRSVVNTFRTVFPEVMVWVTYSDGILIGSRNRIKLDERNLDRRITHPGIYRDLDPFKMGSSDGLLSRFVMGTEGVKEFSRDGIINTDDNLYLEFSAPFSVGIPGSGENLKALLRFREPLSSYLAPVHGSGFSEGEIARLNAAQKAAGLSDQAQVLILKNNFRGEEFRRLAFLLDEDFPDYPRWEFLKAQAARKTGSLAVPLQGIKLAFSGDGNGEFPVAISATRITLSEDVSVVVFADQDRNIKGYFRDLGMADSSSAMAGANQVLIRIREIYQEQAAAAASKGYRYPDRKATMAKIDDYLGRLAKRMM